jgi:MinD-like ATPase involved in chromosome partitioning or flagellar assembly
MNRRDIMTMLDTVNIIAEIPEDVKIQKSVASRVPVIKQFPQAEVSNRIMGVAASLVGQQYDYAVSVPWYKKIFPFIK